MREREMRERVERFLRTRLRNVLLPAALGLGLTVGACNTDGLDASDAGDASAKSDSGTVTTRYMAQQPADAAPDTSRIVALYMAQLPVPRS